MTGLPKRYNLMMNGRCSSAPAGGMGESVVDKMRRPEEVSLLLRLVSEWAGMKTIAQQTVDIEDATDGEWYGLSGLAMIATSHIAFHVWPHYDGYYMFDIASCKEFDPVELRRRIEGYLGKRCEWHRDVNHIPDGQGG